MSSNIGSADILAEMRAAPFEANLDAIALVIRDRVMAQVEFHRGSMPKLLSVWKVQSFHFNCHLGLVMVHLDACWLS